MASKYGDANRTTTRAAVSRCRHPNRQRRLSAKAVLRSAAHIVNAAAIERRMLADQSVVRRRARIVEASSEGEEAQGQEGETHAFSFGTGAFCISSINLSAIVS